MDTTKTPSNYKEGDFTTKDAKVKTIKLDNTWKWLKNTSNSINNSINIEYNGTQRSLIMPNGAVVTNYSTTAKNVTATLTAAEMLSGVITSTSGAAVNLTTPSAADIIALITGGGVGTTFDLMIDNTAGSNTVTIVLDSSIAVTTPVTSGISDVLTVSANNDVGLFRFYFTSKTTAKCFRIF